MQVDKKISTYNGAETEHYNWTQSTKAVDVQIPIPKGTKPRDLLVVIKTKHLKVQIKGQDKPIIDGELDQKVRIDDSFWSIEDGEYLNINFEKSSEVIWKTVITGDSEIDTKKVDNAKNLSEFDHETQGHLRKVLYEQERKKMGLPTTEEEQQQKLMAEMMAKQGMSNPNVQLPYDAAKYQRTDGTNAPVSPFAPQQ